MPTLQVVSDTASSALRRQMRGISSNNRRAIMLMVGTEFQRIGKGALGAQGKHRAESWPALSAKYSKRIGGRTTPTLVMTDTERVKFGKPPGLPHLRDKFAITSVSAREVCVTNDTPYSAAQQLGSGKDSLPARPFFPVNHDEKITPYAGNRILAIIKRGLRHFGAIP